MDTQTLGREEDVELDLEQLHAIQTGWAPKAESASLMDLLKRSLGLDQSLADPTEIQNGSNPLALRNAYKHRLHALRCEYADARLRGIELEEHLAEANLRILRLENRIKLLESMLAQIYASRFWRIKERCARPWRTVKRWLGCRDGLHAKTAQLPNECGFDR